MILPGTIETQWAEKHSAVVVAEKHMLLTNETALWIIIICFCIRVLKIKVLNAEIQEHNGELGYYWHLALQSLYCGMEGCRDVRTND